MTPPHPQATEERPRKRKNFRIPADLADWAEQHAANKNTTMTQLIIDFLTDLHEKETKA